MSQGRNQTRLTEAHWAEIKALYHRVIDVDQEQRAGLLQQASCPPFVLAYVQQLLASEGFTVAVPARSMHAALDELQSRVAPGDLIGPYRLVKLLGQGGMGLVYLAERSDGAYRQNVAIKFMARHFDSLLDRQLFTQERQILAALQHPHIARLLDGGESDDYPYLVMDYIECQGCRRYRGLQSHSVMLYCATLEIADGVGTGIGIDRRTVDICLVGLDGLLAIPEGQRMRRS